ncbi:MAG: PEP-CTERM sorting domain-containing protein [Phycisphaerae bacterium]|nr:PEP-CTERM sorting domain-containing protein [Phycisphaerae bacterium]
MKKSVVTCILVWLMCLGLTSPAQATIVTGWDQWYLSVEPNQPVTCVAHFIPDLDGYVADSLIFTQPPEWTGSFDYISAGWDTTLADSNKTAYLFGPELTNGGLLFSYKTYYQWDDEDPDYDPDYPVYFDLVIFNGDTIVAEFARRGTPGDYDQAIIGTTWSEQDGEPPYENPVPEPMTICLLGFGAAFMKKSRRN